MGDLPKGKVTPSYPFNNCGVDFCGPFMVKFKNQCKGVLIKVYVSIFVCLSTKAIHLDFVSDLTSKAFIACLKRFFGRGKSSKMFSDNGKTFVGANIEFKKLHDLVKAPDETLVILMTNILTGISFLQGLQILVVYGNQVLSPLKPVAGSSNLTLEEFITLLAEIEAVLNSRPLSPLLSDFDDDFETLSPGHFLIGRPVTAIVEPELINVKENRLTRWQRVNWLSQQIWKFRKRNYLNNLQERSKWRFSKNNVEIGILVLIKNESLPGTKWLTGRILEVFYGNDNKKQNKSC
ncbi:integrase catalytic domain-containing protein [Trichonephila clavipes]|nr:integrase catalytic domain-containing protein [Trichonephila clavipes]